MPTNIVIVFDSHFNFTNKCNLIVLCDWVYALLLLFIYLYCVLLPSGTINDDDDDIRLYIFSNAI